MTKKTRRGRTQDRSRVAAGQNYEVRYEAGDYNVQRFGLKGSPSFLRKAICFSAR
jgi:hypothetical protein